MLVIIGLDALIHALAAAWPVAPMVELSRQFSHAEWIGVHAYDLIFPLFIFLSGVSLAIVDARPSAQAKSAGQRLMSAARRMVVLVLLGIRSEEHTSELQSLIRISYAVFSFT